MRDTLRDTHGGFTLFLLCRHLENTLCQLGSCPPPRGCDIIKGEMQCTSSAWWNLICATPFCFLSCLVLAECLQCVPDESPRSSWAEGREGVPRGSRSRRHGGRKGTHQHGRIFGTDTVNMFTDRHFAFALHDTSGLLIRYFEYFYLEQGDPGVRGPMGNPGKEGPKVGRKYQA